jgi:hypothetical protein
MVIQADLSKKLRPKKRLGAGRCLAGKARSLNPRYYQKTIHWTVGLEVGYVKFAKSHLRPQWSCRVCFFFWTKA